MDITKENMIGQGNTAEIYKLDNNKILKLYRTGLHKSIVEREYQNGMIVEKILCVPKVYEMVEIDERHGIVFEEVNGTDMLKTMLRSLWKINSFSKELAHYHLEIQKPVPDSMYSVKKKLEDDLDNVNELSKEMKEIVRNYLKELPDGNVLCHFDFHPGNIMKVDKKAVFIDWMTACKGDPCADVARTCMMLKYGGVEHAPFTVKKLISVLQHRIYKVYIKEYLGISKRSIEDINRWELPIAAARLREWISEKERQVLIQLIKDRCNEIAKKAL